MPEEPLPPSPEFPPDSTAYEPHPYVPLPRESASASGRPWLVALVVAIALLLGLGYGIHQRNQAQRLAAQNDQVTAALRDTRTQIDALTGKLNEMTAAQQARQIAAQQAAERRARPSAARRHRADDPRWKKVQDQLDQQSQAIDATRKDLDSTRTELSGSIARTHDELVVLQRKGERNYYEFDILKSKQFQRQGPVGVKLRKANTKHQYADLELMVDDVNLSKKHVNLLEPVVFYAAEGGRPVELVINKIDKNHIHGYVSEPKYKNSELAVAAASPANAAASSPSSNAPTSTPLKTRKRLEVQEQ